MVDLTDKVIVITGASNSISKAAAMAFARGSRGPAARRAEKLIEIRDTIRTFNDKCMEVPTDVTDEAQVAALFDRTVERFGRVDI